MIFSKIKFSLMMLISIFLVSIIVSFFSSGKGIYTINDQDFYALVVSLYILIFFVVIFFVNTESA
jgi:hypothetical protein